MNIFTYGQIKTILSRKLTSAFSTASFGFEAKDNSYKIDIKQQLVGKSKYVYSLTKIAKTYKDTDERITTKSTSKKQELFDSIQSDLKHLGFKEKKDYGCVEEAKLDLELDNDSIEVSGKVEEFNKVFGDPSNDSFDKLRSGFDTEYIATLTDGERLDILDQAKDIAKKRNNDKFVGRLKAVERIMDEYKRKQATLKEITEVYDNMENLRYKGPNKGVKKFIDGLIENKKDILQADNLNYAVSYYKSLQYLLDTYPELVDEVPVQSTRLTRAETEMQYNGLVKDLTIIDKQKIKYALHDLIRGIKDRDSIEKNIRYLYKVSTDEYSSTSGNNRMVYDTLEEARAVASTGGGAMSGYYSEIAKLEVHTNGNPHGFGELIEVYITDDVFWEKLMDRADCINTAMHYAESGKEYTGTDGFEEISFEEFKINLKTPISYKKMINLLKTKTEEDCLVYIKNKIKNVVRVTRGQDEKLNLFFL